VLLLLSQHPLMLREIY